MATFAEIKELALHAAKGTVPSTYSNKEVDVDAALADCFREYAGSLNQFMKNRYDIYDIIITAADEIVPNKVMDAIGIFAEVQVVPQGQKALFRRKLGKSRAKKFLTQVGLSGVYETFRLDSDTFEVSAHAVGGAASIDFERVLDGADNMADLMEIITEGLVDSVYVEVQKALKAALNATGVPGANRVSVSGFDGDKMMKLISVVKAYGESAVIFAPPEFVAAMGADAIVPVGTNFQGVYHPQDIDRIHNQGYINIFRGTPIVQFPQSFIDESNEKTYIDPTTAYVFPAGKERVVKVVLEGATQMYDFVNRDQSMEIHVYKKIGAAIFAYHNWAIYKNTSITDTSDEVYKFL